MNESTNPYTDHRYPTEIISYAVWLYFRFTLSFRDIEELLAARGLVVTYEAVRQWCLKFGHQYAKEIRCRRPRSGDTGYMDEVFVTIGGQRISSRSGVIRPISVNSIIIVFYFTLQDLCPACRL
jgi:putative transposase